MTATVYTGGSQVVVIKTAPPGNPPPTPAPTITGATATPNSLPVGGGLVTINAIVSNATSVTLDGVVVTLPKTVTVSASKTLVLTATGPTAPPATVSLPVTVAVIVVPPGNATFYDVASAPVGGWITPYTQAADGTIVKGTPYQQPATPAAGLPVLHVGAIKQATPATLASVYATIQPGDYVQLAAGTYSGQYDTEGWNPSNICFFKPGQPGKPITLVGMPGAVAAFVCTTGRSNFQFGKGQPGATYGYVQLASLSMTSGGNCVAGGGNTTNDTQPESGGKFVRVAGCKLTLTDATSNTMTGIHTMEGDNCQAIGNTYRDPANRTPINNNHGVYISNGSDNADVLYNDLRFLHVGHVVQVHQDGNRMDYMNIHIAHNFYEGTTQAACRGVNVGGASNASTILIEDENFKNLGQSFSTIAVYAGVVTIRRIIAVNVNAKLLVSGQGGGTRRITFDNSPGLLPVLYENGGSPADVTIVP